MDIVLIYFSSDVVFIDYVRLICFFLCKNDEDRFLLKLGNFMVIIGWGGKKEYGRIFKRFY